MRFGPFEIVRFLGAGGMAETSLAIRRGEGGFEQRVCLKRILPAFCKDADFVRAFTDEAKLAVRLEHPNVCRLYDFGQLDGTYWMSMEICEGGDLRELVRALREMKQPIPLDVVTLLAVDLAQALHYAHDLVVEGQRIDLVHRDLSPSNVLVDGHGNFKLADFGIARARTNVRATQTGTVKGKAPYMSPDQVQGLPVDQRDDLWSLGVILYECIAGERPFSGVTEMALMMRVMRGERRPLIEAAPGTPAPLVHAVERLLAHDREKRTPSAAALLEDLVAIAPPPTARLRLSKLIATARAEAPKREDSRSQSRLDVAARPVARAVSSGELTPPVLAETPRTAVSGPRATVGGRGLAGIALLVAIVAIVPLAWLAPRWLSAPAPAHVATPAPAPVPSVVLPSSAVMAPPTTLVVPPSAIELAPPPSSALPPPTTTTTTTAVAAAEPEDERGTVDLTAVPWGALFIDGRRVGDGHVVRQLAPGTHRVAAGTDHPFQEQSVTLRPHQRVRLTLRAAP